jgi:hypothetical protein
MPAPLNLLQIVQTACDELGLNRPSVVAGSTDLQIRQLFALVNRDLRELQQDKDWTAFQTEYDLYVQPPIFLVGNVAQGTNVISNVQSLVGDFNSDYNDDYLTGYTGPLGGLANLGSIGGSFGADFGPDFDRGSIPINQLGPMPPSIIANPTLFTITGQNIPVAARAIQADNNIITMSEYATGNLQNAIITASQDTYPEPVDFDRFINQTWWDRTNRWSLMGPDSPVVDQWHRSGVVTIGPRRHFRQIGYNGLTSGGGPLNTYRLWPAPGALDTPIQLVFEYISTTTVLGVSTVNNVTTYTPQPYFQADTDIPILDGNLMILGAKWRLWQIKGFDYAALQAEWQDYGDRKYANDGGAKTLSLSSLRAGMLLSPYQIPDGNWPGPVGSSGI